MAHVEDMDGRRVAGWDVAGELVPEAGEGTAVLAGDVELKVAGPADLRLRFTFGDDSPEHPFRVVADA